MDEQRISEIVQRCKDLCDDDSAEILDLVSQLGSQTARERLFISHHGKSVSDPANSEVIKRRRNELEKLKKNVFYSSDWKSLSTGGFWLPEVISAARRCKEFEAWVIQESDVRNRWINFEIGIAFGAAARRANQSSKPFEHIGVWNGRSDNSQDSRVSPISDWLRHAANPSTLPNHRVSYKIYFSHTLPCRAAKDFRGLVEQVDGGRIKTLARSDVFNPTDSKASQCLASVAAIKSSDHFFALIDTKLGKNGKKGVFDVASPWLNFEVGVAIGLRKRPYVFVTGGISFCEIQSPLKEIMLMGTGDQNRWVTTFKDIGLDHPDFHGPRGPLLEEFAWFFNQRDPGKDPIHPTRGAVNRKPPEPTADENEQD